ncbi:MAG: hypothetical protein JNN27_15900 [Planctomycetes bacterium]|nr:hypothetical protein [Planctomycetota bacterium]
MHDPEAPEPVAAAARVRLVADTKEFRELGGAALACALPEDEESERALFDAALLALTGTLEARGATSGWFVPFRIHGDRPTYRVEFCDLRREREPEIVLKDLTNVEGGCCLALLFWPTGAGWCLLQWESDGIPAAVARGPWNADALPTPSGAGRSTRLASRDSRCWFFHGGHLWIRDPNDPFPVHISFNGPDTDRLAMASSPRSRRWLSKGMAADDRTAYDALLCVPLAQWKEPVWQLIVQASPAPR